jgi:hypothetical protein
MVLTYVWQRFGTRGFQEAFLARESLFHQTRLSDLTSQCMWTVEECGLGISSGGDVAALRMTASRDVRCQQRPRLHR